jgi:hypothetical protein
MTARFICAECGKQIEEGDFMALIGEAPPSGMATPIGRADKIIDDIGKTYCRDCVSEVIYEDFN